jgi:hypothetical protein
MRRGKRPHPAHFHSGYLSGVVLRFSIALYGMNGVNYHYWSKWIIFTSLVVLLCSYFEGLLLFCFPQI